MLVASFDMQHYRLNCVILSAQSIKFNDVDEKRWKVTLMNLIRNTDQALLIKSKDFGLLLHQQL